jgi:hypothetical protein
MADAKDREKARVRSWRTVAALAVVGSTLVALQLSGANVIDMIGSLF